MLSGGRPNNTSVRTSFSSLIRLTRSDNYIKCNKKLVYPILKFFAIVFIECTTFNNFSLLMVILEKNMFMNEDFFDYSNISGIHGEYL